MVVSKTQNLWHAAHFPWSIMSHLSLHGGYVSGTLCISYPLHCFSVFLLFSPSRLSHHLSFKMIIISFTFFLSLILFFFLFLLHLQLYKGLRPKHRYHFVLLRYVFVFRVCRMRWSIWNRAILPIVNLPSVVLQAVGGTPSEPHHECT